MKFGPVVYKGMSYKDDSYLELWRPLCSAEWKHLCNYGRGHYEEQFCEIILNLDHGSGGDVFQRYFNLELWQPYCSAEWDHLCNFGRGYQDEHCCEII